MPWYANNQIEHLLHWSEICTFSNKPVTLKRETVLWHFLKIGNTCDTWWPQNSKTTKWQKHSWHTVAVMPPFNLKDTLFKSIQLTLQGCIIIRLSHRCEKLVLSICCYEHLNSIHRCCCISVLLQYSASCTRWAQTFATHAWPWWLHHQHQHQTTITAIRPSSPITLVIFTTITITANLNDSHDDVCLLSFLHHTMVKRSDCAQL